MVCDFCFGGGEEGGQRGPNLLPSVPCIRGSRLLFLGYLLLAFFLYRSIKLPLISPISHSFRTSTSRSFGSRFPYLSRSLFSEPPVLPHCLHTSLPTDVFSLIWRGGGGEFGKCESMSKARVTTPPPTVLCWRSIFPSLYSK